MPNNTFQGATLRDLVEEQGGRYLDKTFLFFEEEEISYGKLDEIANKVGNALRSLGVRKGDRVAIYLPNCTEYVLTFFGCFKIGAVAVPINTLLKPPEVEYLLRNSQAKILITNGDNLARIDEIRGSCWDLTRTVVVNARVPEGCVPFDGFYRASSQAPEVAVAADDPAMILYTAGTTGRPKGALLTHRGYIYNATACARAAEFREQDRFCCLLPLFHVNAQVVTMLVPMVGGGSMVLLDGFHPSTFLHDLERYQVTSFSAVPTIYAILNGLSTEEDYDLSHLRFCVCGAAPMPVDVFEEFERKFKAYILEGYGLSEGTCVVTMNPLRGTRKIGSIGLPLPGQEVKIVDDDGKELRNGEIGEIIVRGPGIMREYVGDEEETARAVRDGWLHTGDLGHRDGDGYFYIDGLKKTMIIRGGENIYPREIEAVLTEHPKVADAVVIGVPHKVYGEEVACVVVPRSGDAIDEAELRAWVAARLADYKLPKSYEIIARVPRTATGKVHRSKVRDEFIARHPA